jgi:hypothetical protein
VKKLRYPSDNCLRWSSKMAEMVAAKLFTGGLHQNRQDLSFSHDSDVYSANRKRTMSCGMSVANLGPSSDKMRHFHEYSYLFVRFLLNLIVKIPRVEQLAGCWRWRRSKAAVGNTAKRWEVGVVYRTNWIKAPTSI